MTVSYTVEGRPVSESALADLATRLRAAAPDADARVAPSAVALDVALTVRVDHELEAIRVAVSTANAVLGDASVRAIAERL